MIEVSLLGLSVFPHEGESPVFKERWEARSFAMVIRLHERGLFTWTEWAESLAQEIRAASASGDADLGDTYYQHWLRTLEALVARKGATSTDELTRYQHAWADAAERTPHGSPIEPPSQQ